MSEVNCSLCDEEFDPFIEGRILDSNKYVCADCMIKMHQKMANDFMRKEIAKKKAGGA